MRNPYLYEDVPVQKNMLGIKDAGTLEKADSAGENQSAHDGMMGSAQRLIWKYLDGNVRDATGRITQPRYTDDWYKKIVQDHGSAITLPK
jgi:hypothetical protein